MKITNTLVLSTIVGEMLIPHHSAFIVSPAALGVTTPSVGTQQNIPSRRTGRGSKPLRMSTNPNNESREVTPKMEKYLKRMNEVLGAKRMSPEKKMYKIRILRSLADEGCYAVSVGDEDYGLDFLDQPIVDEPDDDADADESVDAPQDEEAVPEEEAPASTAQPVVGDDQNAESVAEEVVMVAEQEENADTVVRGVGGMADTRDPELLDHDDPRKSISAAPTFEEYLKARKGTAT